MWAYILRAAAMSSEHKPWHKKPLAWVSLGLLELLVIVLLTLRLCSAPRPLSNHAAANEGVAHSSARVEPAPEPRSTPAPVPSAIEPARPSHASACMRSPVRGCAPYRDERGCYFCLKCSRIFHYDTSLGPRDLSFSCLDMPPGSLYFEISEGAPDSGATARWSVAVAAGGHSSEQTVAADLGVAYFGELAQGGSVDADVSLRGCADGSSNCSGDVFAAVSIRRDAAPPPVTP